MSDRRTAGFYWLAALFCLQSTARAQQPVIPVWPRAAPGSERWTQKEVEYRNPQGQRMVRNVVKPTRQGKFRPLGRPDAIMVNGVQGLREGSFTLVTYTREERDNYDDLVTMSQVLLLRMPPDQGEDFGDSLYFATDGSAPQVRPLENRTTHRTISQNWTEQFRPLDSIDYGENLSQPVPTPAPMPM